MDKGFLKFFKEKKDVTKIVLVIALGVIMIFMGSLNEKTGETAEPGVEERIAAACSTVDGVGECSVLVYYKPSASGDREEVESVIVICDGADSSDVRLTLTEMLSSFFGIGTNRIRIEKRR